MRYLRCIPLFLLLIFCALLTGCQSGREKDHYTSRGVDDGIEGFLFNFDQRDAVQSMVRFKNKGQYPVKISWHYLEETGRETEAVQEPETESLTEEEVSPETESLTEEEVSPETEPISEETSVMYSEDPGVIRDAYFALSNTIIIDVATGHKENPHYFISFTLPDGDECRFDFATESILHLGDQNYVLESDGNLWRILRAVENKS